ncbi:MAG: hypothetical protein CSA22_06410 [Deltaproteobacteria bacterium]|nr:MAG: hypothetical protein CSA22_06410 [Deltaproteobacteria bacterium]
MSLIASAAELISRSRYAVAVCGAGVSAESGIDTFRDPGGVWDRLDPMMVGTPDGLVNALNTHGKLLKRFFSGLLKTLETAQPNPGHLALAALEEKGMLGTVITQNIDNLHQEAGSQHVLDVHGNLFAFECLGCHHHQKFDRAAVLPAMRATLDTMTQFDLNAAKQLLPVCDRCNAPMRPDVVMFGESVKKLPEAFSAVGQCDLLMVLGTSGTVYPVAGFPSTAKQSGAKIVVINPMEDAFSHLSDLYLPLKTGEALPAILELL